MMSDEFLVDRSGNGRDLTAQEVQGGPCSEPLRSELKRLADNPAKGLVWFGGSAYDEVHRVSSVPGLPKHGGPGSDLAKHDGDPAADVWAESYGVAWSPIQPRELHQAPPVDVFANAPAYEPLELVCGSYSASERPQRYLLADVRRWAAGDFDALHSTPREVIATLAETVRALLLESTRVPLPATFQQGVEWARWPANGPDAIMTAMQIWVSLREKGNPSATEEQIAARLEGLRPWDFPMIYIEGTPPVWKRKMVRVDALERWARGDQRDITAPADWMISMLASEVLNWSGL